MLKFLQHCSIVLLMLLLCGFQELSGQTVYIGINSDWENPSNWTNNLPASGNNALLPGGSEVTINAPLMVDFLIESYGTININQAVTIGLSGNIQNSGTINISGTSITNQGVFNSYVALNIDASSSFTNQITGNFFSNGIITNNGILTNEGNFSSLNTLTNNGTFTNSGNFSNNVLLNNNGTINNSGGSFTNQLGAILNNSGLLTHSGGSLGNSGTINVTGRVETTAAFTNSQTIVIDSIWVSSFNFENAGTIIVNTNGELQNNSQLNNYNTITADGLINNTGSLFNSSTLTVSTNGTLNNTGTVNSFPGTNITNSGIINNTSIFISAATLTNNNTFNNDGSLTLQNGGTTVNIGTLNNSGNIQAQGMLNSSGTLQQNAGGSFAISASGNFNNSGTATFGLGSQFTNDGAVTNTLILILDGELTNQLNFINQGTITQNGTITNFASFTNNAIGTHTIQSSAIFNNDEGGIYQNDGVINNAGTFNNLTCATLINDNTINNTSIITNAGIYINNATFSGNAIQQSGGTTPSPTGLTCAGTYTAYLSSDGTANVIPQDIVLSNFCNGLSFDLNGEEFLTYDCSQNNTSEVVTVTATNYLNDSFSCSTTVHVRDTLAPMLANCPANMEVSATSSNGASVTWVAPTATDNCCLQSLTANHPNGGILPIGNNIITYTAMDCNGNATACSFVVRVGERICSANRIESDLVALYDFKNISNNIVEDKSNFQTPLNLTIEQPTAVSSPGGCGLTINSSTIVKSSTSASKVSQAIRNANEISMEVWVEPSNLTQTAARIFTISSTPTKANAMLGQNGNRLVQRLRASSTGNSGVPEASATITTGLQHYVYTRNATGIEKIYINGVNVYTGVRIGNLLNWNETYFLAIGNELTNDNSWLGTIYLAAIYKKALTPSQVQQNYNASVCCTITVSEATINGAVNDCPSPISSLRRDVWSNISGTDISRITLNDNYPDNPNSTSYIAQLQSSTNVGNNFGESVVGYLRPSVSGIYSFTVTGDADVDVYLSSDGSENNISRIAYIDGYTTAFEFNKYTSQNSSQIYLFADKDYYIQVLHKQAASNGFFSVFWIKPNTTNRELIPSENFAAVANCPENIEYGNPCPAPWGGLLREVWTNISGSGSINDLTAINSYPDNPTTTDQIATSQAPNNFGNYFGERWRGHLRVPVAGAYSFVITGDKEVDLFISANFEPQHKVKIATLTGGTEPLEFSKYPTQRTIPITLIPGREYYLELLHSDGTGADHAAIYWKRPDSDTYTLIPSECLAPYKQCGGEEEVPCTNNALFVVGNATNLSAADALIKQRMESLGLQVTVKKDALVQTVDAQGTSLIVISSSVIAGYVNTKFTNVAVPVVTWEAWLYDDLQMTGELLGSDYGVYGTAFQVQSTNPNHP
ncbi:MAG: LamG-like jellyroll fold domain-containing protein, partial [Saprospiraceae bacterium]